MLKMKKTRFILSGALISISVLALVGIAYVSHIGNITKKDEIRNNAIDTNTVQDFSTKASNMVIDAGYGSYAAIIDGKLYTWGQNAYGVLGHGHSNTVKNPTWVSSLGSNVTDVSLGHGYAGAITADGVYMWGDNVSGRLGTGDLTDRWYPTRVIAGTGFSSLSCNKFVKLDHMSFSSGHTAVVHNNQTYTWGDNRYDQLGRNTRGTLYSTDIVPINKIRPYWPDTYKNPVSYMVEVGANHTIGVARFDNGVYSLYGFGRNSIASTSSDGPKGHELPDDVTTYSTVKEPLTFEHVSYDGKYLRGDYVMVDTHEEHSIASINGKVWTWGSNTYGQLGFYTGDYYSGSYAAQRVSLPWVKYVVAGVGRNFVIVQPGVGLNELGDLYGWGRGIGTSPRLISTGKWSQVATDVSSYDGKNIGINDDEIWTWTSNTAERLVFKENIVIALNAINDPDGYRNTVVYNIDDAAIKKLINQSKNLMQLPTSYTYGYWWNSGSVLMSGVNKGIIDFTVKSDSNYWFYEYLVELTGFVPVKETATVDTGMVLPVNEEEPLFVNMGVNQIVDEANRNKDTSKLANWIYTKSNYKKIFNPDGRYNEFFPRNTNIIGISDVNHVKNSVDSTKWDIRFRITVDKYYKKTGDVINLSSGSMTLDKYITISNLPQVTYEEEIVDDNKNLVILDTRINHGGVDITDADTFFKTLTGSSEGGKVNAAEVALLRKYVDIRFIPDRYYDSDLNTRLDNNYSIYRNSTEDVDTEAAKHISFTLMADKYFTNYGELKSDYFNNVQFRIERKNSSDIQQIENTQELTKQYTTGDFIDLFAPNTKTTVQNNNINKKIAKNYLKFINFPGDTIYNLITTDGLNENERGKLSFKVHANKYYVDNKFGLQDDGKTFDTLFALEGFKPSYDLADYPVEMYHDSITQINSSASFYDETTDGSGTDVNIKAMSQYINMRAIPDGANVSLTRLSNNNSSAIKFKIETDKYTDNGGRTINNMKEWEFEIKIASIDATLITILVTAGVFLIFLIGALIVTIKNKRSIEIQQGAEVI